MNLPEIDRNAVVFELPPPSLRDDATENSDSEQDQIFEVTAEDMAIMARHLAEKSENLNVLIPRKYLEEKNRKRRENAWKNCVVRFKLFGKYIIQALFISSEPVSCLFNFINENISIGQFNLRYSMKKLEKNEITLLNADLVPKSNIIIHPINLFSFNSLDEFLIKTKNIKKCSEKEAELISTKWLSQNSIYQPQSQNLDDTNNTQINISDINSLDILRRREARENSQPLPKWFKKK